MLSKCSIVPTAHSGPSHSQKFPRLLIESIEEEHCHIRLNRWLSQAENTKLRTQYFLQKEGWLCRMITATCDMETHIKVLNLDVRNLSFALGESVSLLPSLHMQNVCVFAFLCKKMLQLSSFSHRKL